MAEKLDEEKAFKKYRYFKPDVDATGTLLQRFHRHIGGFLALKLEHTKITPNQLTILSFIFVLIASGIFYLKSHLFFILGAICIFFSITLDHADGSLARLKKQTSKVGEWLDSTTDNLKVYALLAIIATVVHQITGEWIAWILAFSTLASWHAAKFSFLYFKKYFSFADKIIKEEKSKHNLRSLLHFNEHFLFNFVIISALFNIFYWFLWICAIYGWVYYLALYFTLTKKALKHKE